MHREDVEKARKKGKKGDRICLRVSDRDGERERERERKRERE